MKTIKISQIHKNVQTQFTEYIQANFPVLITQATEWINGVGKTIAEKYNNPQTGYDIPSIVEEFNQYLKNLQKQQMMAR